MIVKAFLEEGIVASKSGVLKLLRKYTESRGIGRKSGSGTHSKVDERILNALHFEWVQFYKTTVCVN